MIIRKAEKSDLQAILEIYNYEVLNGTATLDIAPRTIEQHTAWFNAHNTDNHPLYVAVDGEKVVGYVSLSMYREKEAYNSTCELSVYVHHERQGEGVATRLMEHILSVAKADETIHTVVSVITSGNEASARLHKKFGFEYCGTIRNAAVKFGKFIDIENYRVSV